MGEHMVGERAIGVDAARHDLGHHVGDHEVDPFERRDDRLLGRGEAGRFGSSRTYERLAGGGLVDGAAEHGSARWDPVGTSSPPSIEPGATRERGRGRQPSTSRPASARRSASSRPTGTSIRNRSTPAATPSLLRRARRPGRVPGASSRSTADRRHPAGPAARAGEAVGIHVLERPAHEAMKPASASGD